MSGTRLGMSSKLESNTWLYDTSRIGEALPIMSFTLRARSRMLISAPFPMLNT